MPECAEHRPYEQEGIQGKQESHCEPCVSGRLGRSHRPEDSSISGSPSATPSSSSLYAVLPVRNTRFLPFYNLLFRAYNSIYLAVIN